MGVGKGGFLGVWWLVCFGFFFVCFGFIWFVWLFKFGLVCLIDLACFVLFLLVVGLYTVVRLVVSCLFNDDTGLIKGPPKKVRRFWKSPKSKKVGSPPPNLGKILDDVGGLWICFYGI